MFVTRKGVHEYLQALNRGRVAESLLLIGPRLSVLLPVVRPGRRGPLPGSHSKGSQLQLRAIWENICFQE